MRVTQSMYYKNLYAQNNSQINSKLFDVNKQIASGLKIQYASDDVLTFSDTMRLDNEITTLTQIKRSTESGYKTSNQTDSILNDFTSTLDRTKTLLIQAANDTQSVTSRNAIAAELRGLESHFKNLANTSINGQFLFSGSAVNIKPIADDGTYMGNDHSLKSFLGSGMEQDYNLTGAELFLGEESLVKRQITTNMPQYNLSAKYPDFNDSNSDVNGTQRIITTENTIRDLMGSLSDNANASSHFYIRGVKSNGEAFKEQISMNDGETVGELLTQIGNAFGNTSDANLVNVTLDPTGSIMIEDKQSGSSKLDFHMVGAIDFDLIDGDHADINAGLYGVTAGQIDHLAAGETNFDKIMKGTSTADNDKLFVKEFVRSSFEASPRVSSTISAEFSMDGAVAAGDTLSLGISYANGSTTTFTQVFNTNATTTYVDLKNAIETTGDFTVGINTTDPANPVITLNVTTQGIQNGARISTSLTNDNPLVTVTSDILNSSIPTDNNALLYDRTMFTQDGSYLHSTTPQVLKSTNAFARDATKLSEVFDLSRGTSDTADDGLAPKQLKLEGTDTGGSKYTAVINFKSPGSEFVIDTTGNGIVDTTYPIYDMSTTRAGVDANDMTYRQLMDVVNMIATGNIPSSTSSATDYDKAIEDSNFSGQTTLSHDGKLTFKDLHSSNTKANISMYDSNSGSFLLTDDASVITFNSNNALTISDPKIDFFKQLNEIITAVEENKMHQDGASATLRNTGMANALTMISNLSEHVARSQSKVGSNSNALSTSLERTTLLEVSTKILRSSVVDVDLAEASLQLTQLSLNYEAMLSTVGKISKLSLVNYL